jgi:MFS family permease
LILVRFYHGFATAIFIPVARATITEYYPSKRGERISTFTSATIVGRGIAPFLGGFVLTATVWNFQVLYVIVGLAGITTFILTFMLLTDRPPPESTPSRPLKAQSHLARTGGWRRVLGTPHILITSTTEAATRYVYGALEFFLIGYLKNVAQLDPSLIGVIMGMQLILIPVVSPFLGRLSDRIGRRTPIIMGLIISGLPLIGIPYVTGFLPLLVIAMVYGVGFATVVSSTPALVGDLATTESIGAAMGFLATIMDVGQMFGPILTGVILASVGYTGSFWSLGIILLGFGALFSVVPVLRKPR